MAANKRCLVIDDSDVVRRVAKQILTSMDFEVSEAENGEQALDACRAAMPDAIIVDWQMPVISGLEFISLLRNQPDGEKPVIVYCTTENDPQDIARALREFQATRTLQGVMYVHRAQPNHPAETACPPW